MDIGTEHRVDTRTCRQPGLSVAPFHLPTSKVFIHHSTNLTLRINESATGSKGPPRLSKLPLSVFICSTLIMPILTLTMSVIEVQYTLIVKIVSQCLYVWYCPLKEGMDWSWLPAARSSFVTSVHLPASVFARQHEHSPAFATHDIYIL